MEAFHKQLPLAALRGERVEWNLADPPQRSATRKVARNLARTHVNPLLYELPINGGLRGFSPHLHTCFYAMLCVNDGQMPLRSRGLRLFLPTWSDAASLVVAQLFCTSTGCVRAAYEA